MIYRIISRRKIRNINYLKSFHDDANTSINTNLSISLSHIFIRSLKQLMHYVEKFFMESKITIDSKADIHHQLGNL
jgi:hypothetical protein